MAVKTISEQGVIQEALAVLLEHMSPSKVARFWAASQAGSGDYLEMRQDLFADETVDTLYEKVKTYQTRTRKR